MSNAVILAERRINAAIIALSSQQPAHLFTMWRARLRRARAEQRRAYRLVYARADKAMDGGSGEPAPTPTKLVLPGPLRSAKQPDGTYWSYTRITVYKPSARGIQAKSLPPSLHSLAANLHSLHLTLLAVSLLGSQDLLTLRCAPGPWLTAADESFRKCQAAYKYPKVPSTAAWRASIIITTREQHESWLHAVPEEAGRPVSVVPWGGPLLDPDDLDVIRRAGAVLTQA